MIKMVITLKRREGMTHDEFTHYQKNIHRPLLMSIPETKQYIRRFVVSYPPVPRAGIRFGGGSLVRQHGRSRSAVLQ